MRMPAPTIDGKNSHSCPVGTSVGHCSVYVVRSVSWLHHLSLIASALLSVNFGEKKGKREKEGIEHLANKNRNDVAVEHWPECSSYERPTTVPLADQEICRRVEACVANDGKDAVLLTDYRSVTNGQYNNDSVSCNMSTIKNTGTPGASRLNLLNNFKYEYFVAGISGGVVSTLMLHPLDLIKIRFAGESRAHDRTSPVHPSVRPSLYPSIYLSVCPSVRPSVGRSVGRSVRAARIYVYAIALGKMATVAARVTPRVHVVHADARKCSYVQGWRAFEHVLFPLSFLRDLETNGNRASLNSWDNARRSFLHSHENAMPLEQPY